MASRPKWTLAKLLVLCSVLLLVPCLGCSALTPTIENEPGIQRVPGIERYSTVEIVPISSAPWVDVKYEDRAKIRASFLKQLRDVGFAVSVEDSVPQTEGVVRLTGLIDYNERSIADSRGRMRLQVSLVDKATGDTLSQANLRSKTIKGWFDHPDDRRTGEAIGARLIEYFEAVGFPYRK